MSQPSPDRTPGTTSHCLICGHDYHDVILDKCTKCGGLCSQITDHDMTLMERRQTRGEIIIDSDTYRRW